MASVELLQSCSEDARVLLAAAETGWERPVRHCSPWDAAELVRHCGGLFAWVAAVVDSGDRVSRRTLEVAPEDTARLPGWYLSGLERVIDVCGSSPPDARTWTFSGTGDRRVSWWWRRMAAEVAVHRWDAQQAAADGGGPPPGPVNGVIAGAGIEEFVVEFLPGLLSREATGMTGTLHLHATDGPCEWWMDLDAGGSALPEHARADTALRATRSDLFLWLWNRDPAEPLEILGTQAVVERWGQLQI